MDEHHKGCQCDCNVCIETLKRQLKDRDETIKRLVRVLDELTVRGPPLASEDSVNSYCAKCTQ